MSEPIHKHELNVALTVAEKRGEVTIKVASENPIVITLTPGAAKEISHRLYQAALKAWV